MSIDTLEDALKTEGWLFKNEVLLDVLKVEANLLRGRIQEIGDDEPKGFGLVQDDWTAEDFEQFTKERTAA